MLLRNYRQNSNISRTLESIELDDPSDVAGASSAFTAPATSSFLTL